MALLTGVRVETATTGTGTLTLGLGVEGFIPLASHPEAVDQAEYSYVIETGFVAGVVKAREWGKGVWTAATNTLTRVVHQSVTAAGIVSTNPLDLVGTSHVAITALAEDIEAEEFPSGTRMLFHQTASPLGWTKQTSLNNRALRLVSGVVGGGGNLPFTTVFGLTSTDAHTLNAAQIPAHVHSGNSLSVSNVSGHQHTYLPPGGLINFAGGSNAAHVFNNNTNLTGLAGGHEHDITGNTGSVGGGGGHSHNMDMRVHYTDVIIAEKD